MNPFDVSGELRSKRNSFPMTFLLLFNDSIRACTKPPQTRSANPAAAQFDLTLYYNKFWPIDYIHGGNPQKPATFCLAPAASLGFGLEPVRTLMECVKPHQSSWRKIAVKCGTASDYEGWRPPVFAGELVKKARSHGVYRGNIVSEGLNKDCQWKDTLAALTKAVDSTNIYKYILMECLDKGIELPAAASRVVTMSP
ncbi:hypothetical protein DFH07DRAFT_769822 [Mycena maculata]|uniref:Uncharacterized protein n=1 Tax=Mycena maculata TaxID=230809 RepID=A0AAD7NML6_9AGAR|nr:hypothetical protein DFH07DRAFT_769822 [Mycena maculata]